MPHYQAQGLLPQKRFTTVKRPGGGIYYEHIISAEGFDAEESIIYRLAMPTRILRKRVEVIRRNFPDVLTGNALFHVASVPESGDYFSARKEMLFSDDLIFSIAKPTASMANFYRNAVADELVTVIEGAGVMRSVFGEIAYGPLDIICIPRGHTIQWLTDGSPQILAITESRSSLRVPAKFLKPNGQYRDDAPFHERDIRAPQLVDPIEEDGELEILIKGIDTVTNAIVQHHPFDAVGWDGGYYPWALNLANYEPKAGRVHLLPDQFMAFQTPETMISFITPRRLADHPESTPLQPYHQNAHFDEILYRFSGSTGETEPGGGTFTLHPQGFDHGPKPGFEGSPPRSYQEAWGLMVDTRAHLRVTLTAQEHMDESYDQMYLTGSELKLLNSVTG